MTKQDLLALLDRLEDAPAMAIDNRISGMPVSALIRLAGDLPSDGVLMLDYPELTMRQVNTLNRFRLVIKGVIEYKTRSQLRERGMING